VPRVREGCCCCCLLQQVAAAATAVGTYGTPATAGYPIVSQSADTLDLLIAASTTALSAGSVRVFAVIVDATDRIGPASVLRTQI
jgi:hypothetical protein